MRRAKEAYTPDPKVVADMKKELGNLWQPQGEIKFYKGKGTPIVAIRDITADGYF